MDNQNGLLFLTSPERNVNKLIPMKEQTERWRDLRKGNIPPLHEPVWLLKSNRKIVKAELCKIEEYDTCIKYEWFTEEINIQIIVDKNKNTAYKCGCYWRADLFLPEDFS